MNLNKLFSHIKYNINNNQTINNLDNILKNYNGLDWKSYINNNTNNNYNKELINKNEDFDMYIITWNKYKESSIHDHSVNGCIYKVLHGTLIEELYNNNLKQIQKNILHKDTIKYIDNIIGYHKIINPTDDISVSLHIYSPPNYKTKYHSNIIK